MSIVGYPQTNRYPGYLQFVSYSVVITCTCDIKCSTDEKSNRQT